MVGTGVKNPTGGGRSSDSRKDRTSCWAFEKLLADVAKDFNNAVPEQFPATMNASLESIARFLSFNRCSILLFGRKPNRLQVTYGWAADGVPPVQIGHHLGGEWYIHQVRSGHLLLLETLSDLPPEAERERLLLLETGVKSLLSIPLVADMQSIGAVTFGSFLSEQRWPPEIVLRFRLVGEILTLAIQKHSSSTALARLAKQVGNLESPTRGFSSGNEQMRRSAWHLMEAEHREKRRLVETIHEGVMQTLSAAIYMMGSSHGDAGSISPKAQVRATELVQSSIRDLRKLATAILPQALSEFGLDAALRWLVEQISQLHGMEVELNLDITVPDEDLRMLLYEAARELLLNAAVHGHATKAAVSLQRASQTELQLSVKDNGEGFDTGLLENIPSKSFGLFTLREKIQLLGGLLEIASTPGRGTDARVKLPQEPG